MTSLEGKNMSAFRKRYFLYKELRKIGSKIEHELNLSKEQRNYFWVLE